MQGPAADLWRGKYQSHRGQSRTAWASHAFKCHGRTNKARKFVTGSFCLGCQKEFWEYKRLLHHVQYSKTCQRKLARAELQVEALEPGMNSRIQKRQPEELLKRTLDPSPRSGTTTT